MSTPHTTVVVTMAGLGRRFREAGYDLPKYQIEVHGRTLFAWSLRSLEAFRRAGASFVFVALAADRARSFVEAECERLSIAKPTLIELDAMTDGQATTAMRALESVPALSALAIYNIDTLVHPAYLDPARAKGDGWIPCFPGEGSAWSFVSVDERDRALNVREKSRISPHATIGLYWFSSADLYRRTYDAFFADARGAEKGERYIAPMYNHLIAEGREVTIARLPSEALVPLGTPADVETFRKAAAPRFDEPHGTPLAVPRSPP